jgi:hypothetical protein
VKTWTKETPRRIQLSRRRGWRQPRNCVRVDRSTVYGNPFRPSFIAPNEADARARRLGRQVVVRRRHVGNDADLRCVELFQRWARGMALDYRAWLTPEALDVFATLDERRRKLVAALPELYRRLDAGGCVGCWCKPDAVCHGEILLALWRERFTERPVPILFGGREG